MHRAALHQHFPNHYGVCLKWHPGKIRFKEGEEPLKPGDKVIPRMSKPSLGFQPGLKRRK